MSNGPQLTDPASVGGLPRSGFADAADKLLSPSDACVFSLDLQDVLVARHDASAGPCVLSTRKGGKVHRNPNRSTQPP